MHPLPPGRCSDPPPPNVFPPLPLPTDVILSTVACFPVSLYAARAVSPSPPPRAPPFPRRAPPPAGHAPSLPTGPVAALLTADATTTPAAAAALRTDLLSPFPPSPFSGTAGRRPVGVVYARLPASVSAARLRERLFYPAVSASGWRPPGVWAACLPPSFGRP